MRIQHSDTLSIDGPLKRGHTFPFGIPGFGMPSSPRMRLPLLGGLQAQLFLRFQLADDRDDMLAEIFDLFLEMQEAEQDMEPVT